MNEPEYDYATWLRLASGVMVCGPVDASFANRGIENGLNPNAVWRLHEKVARRQHYSESEHELGGEA